MARNKPVPGLDSSREIVPGALEDFWYFVSERHNVFIKKSIQKLPPPWTDDPIIQKWKFCNIFRYLDRQSMALVGNVIQPHIDDDSALLLFNIFAFRAFNWYPTYQKIGWTTDWDPTYIKMNLHNHVEGGGKLTSGAYMIRGRKDQPKWRSIVDSLSDIWSQKEALVDYIESNPPSLEQTWRLIVENKFWGWGPFTSYQIVLDLMYTPLLKGATDVNTWTCFGPGAMRGLREIWPNLPKGEMLAAAERLLNHQSKRGKHVAQLNLQDIEFTLCELGKYRRIKRGGKGKEKFTVLGDVNLSRL